MFPSISFSHIALVGIGGLLGSVSRFLVLGLTHRIFPQLSFPLGTLLINVVGCFLIGLFYGLADSRQLLADEVRLFLVIGLLGGFTTYSTFGYETLTLLRNEDASWAVANIATHLVFGIGAVWLGNALGRFG